MLELDSALVGAARTGPLLEHGGVRYAAPSMRAQGPQDANHGQCRSHWQRATNAVRSGRPALASRDAWSVACGEGCKGARETNR